MAFEASEEVCRIIKENIQLNELQGKVKVVNNVISNVSGYIIDFFEILHLEVHLQYKVT